MTPTVRRLQRLSRSCTAPAERSPTISKRAMSLRISTGRSKRASVSRAPALKANSAVPSARPRRSRARAHAPARRGGVVGAQHGDAEPPRRVVGGGERAGAFDAAGDDADAAGGEARQRFGETGTVAEVGAVGQPD